MHELSIASAIIDLASEAVGAEGLDRRSARITGVRVRVGALSGVVPEALEFAWDAAREGTACAHATLDIERVAAEARCAACGEGFEVGAAHLFRCPACGGGGEVLTGRELELVRLELDESGAPSAQGVCDHAAADS